MNDISPVMQEYKRLEQELLALRQQHNNKYSPAEGYLLDEMTAVWDELSMAEQDIIYAQGPKIPRP